MAAPSSTPVLIVGAGPTGLMLACQLARHGVAFRLVDGKSGPTRESRALGVQARTLELYDTLGIAGEAVSQGRPTYSANLYVGLQRVQRIPLGDVGQDATPYPFLLILEQSRNEALLYQTLCASGETVDWGCRLERFEQDADGVVAVLQPAGGGRPQQLRADWLVACDGARSTVREQLGLAFSGGTYEQVFYVADTAVDWPLPHGELTVCLSHRTFAALFPMPGEHRYRVVGVLPPGYEGNEAGLRFEDIEAAVRQQMDVPVSFSDTRWFASYRVHHRCVERFRSGRCFLAGDAAHVHSPVGAQGMNTGLQDACNLAWKLALVVRRQAPAALLDSYHEERWPLAQRLLRTTDAAFRFVVSREPLMRALRLQAVPRVLPGLLSLPAVQQRVFRALSQIGLNYRGRSLAVTLASAGLQAGDRLPYVRIEPPLASRAMSVYAWLRPARFNLLLLQRQSAGLEAEAGQWQAELEAACPGWFSVHALPAELGGAGLLAALKVGDRAVLLVRPDHYIAWLADRFDRPALRSYLAEMLGLLARP
ncbi:FAD-dependent monooxygenase [Aquabacterium sp. A7-Y]|uniref:FAD-dependent monooxygenase n=1 Tax=Aquabacterium sp. A7-Y TaxID=1349605 RepID=UPI00223E5B39|nr:FAD-dependent monooxygenase [Aquabacterium sp. A7-Y]MCW7540252.1 FAD-dependent monooxygenase [Aquabacterium sp. A7-Y]